MRSHVVIFTCSALLILLILPRAVLAVETEPFPSSSISFELVSNALAWFLPLGVTLVAVGASDSERARHAAVSLPLAMAVAAAGYTLTGFGLQFGGVGLVSEQPAFASLVSEWSPLDLSQGPGWGLLGLRGFGFPVELRSEDTLMLLLSQLPLVTMTAVIPLLAIGDRLRPLPSALLAALISGVVYPIVGNWVRGGGWLSQLGVTSDLGQGFVDFGLSTYHLVGACAALAGLFAFRRVEPRQPAQGTPQLPRVYLPLNVLLGGCLALVGWMVVQVAQPLIDHASISRPTAMLNALLAISGSALASLLYGWLVRGQFDTGLVGRGIIAGLVAIGPSVAFVPPLAAVCIGAISGLALAPTMYLTERVVGLDDRAAALSVHGASAIWGLLALGIFANGTQGSGWGANSALPAGSAQGVTGLLAVSDLVPDVGQLYAQIFGLMGILVFALALPWLLLGVLSKAYISPATMSALAGGRTSHAKPSAAVWASTGSGEAVREKLRASFDRIALMFARTDEADPYALEGGDETLEEPGVPEEPTPAPHRHFPSSS